MIAMYILKYIDRGHPPILMAKSHQVCGVGERGVERPARALSANRAEL
jgi:hypothetical protein